jgi:PP-loop superfamily ATP-utilizing enzyme
MSRRCWGESVASLRITNLLHRELPDSKACKRNGIKFPQIKRRNVKRDFTGPRKPLLLLQKAHLTQLQKAADDSDSKQFLKSQNFSDLSEHRPGGASQAVKELANVSQPMGGQQIYQRRNPSSRQEMGLSSKQTLVSCLASRIL